MGIVEFFLRIWDNLAWIFNADGSDEVFQAIFNIIQLVVENFFNLFS